MTFERLKLLGGERLYLPAQKEPVLVDLTELKSGKGKSQRSDFSRSPWCKPLTAWA